MSAVRCIEAPNQRLDGKLADEHQQITRVIRPHPSPRRLRLKPAGCYTPNLLAQVHRSGEVAQSVRLGALIERQYGVGTGIARKFMDFMVAGWSLYIYISQY